MGKNLQICALLYVYGIFLSEKQRTLAEHYYYEDLSLGEIAENEGITRQGVRDLIKRAEQQMLRFEAECGYCQKFAALRREAEALERKSHKTLVEIIEKL